MAKSAADVAAQERGLMIAGWDGKKYCAYLHFGAPQITKVMIHFETWMPLAPLLPEKMPP